MYAQTWIFAGLSFNPMLKRKSFYDLLEGGYSTFTKDKTRGKSDYNNEMKLGHNYKNKYHLRTAQSSNDYVFHIGGDRHIKPGK